ncbi:MAG: DUF2828 family protein, partial [Candidatus Thorarchaeota archaeon]
MSKFAKAMNASARTWNNAVSLVSPDPTGQVAGRLALFFKSAQGLNAPMLYQYIRDASRESFIDAFVLAFHIRDCRGGKGLRELGRRALVWLFLTYPDKFRKVLHLVPDYGRWDDLLHFFPRVLNLENIDHIRANYTVDVPDRQHLENLQALQREVVAHYAQRLKDDKKAMEEGKQCTLAAKWTPTERDSLDRAHGVFAELARVLGVSPRNLRKLYNTPLRAYVNVVERFICSGQWDHVDYSKVPSHAMKRLRKAFEKHDEARFQEWRANLTREDGDEKKTKVNAKQLHPHELVREFRTRGATDGVVEAQWKVLVEEVRKLGTLQDTVVVCDTSSSMHSPEYLPFDISCAMGMIISEVVEGPFHNHVITFNSTPEFAVVRDGSAFDRWRQVSGINWGGSTNLQATFELILNRGRSAGLTDEDMPRRLIIVSDMQFNQISRSGWYGTSEYQTNFEAIDQMYAAAGYTRPQ